MQRTTNCLQCKHNSVVTLQKKKSVLREFCEKVNALGVAHRMLQQIKTKQSNMASDSKAKDAEIKKKATARLQLAPLCTSDSHPRQNHVYFRRHLPFTD